MNTRPKLLVSVRSAAEALAALRGGADLIDVKEPNNGPLGKAADDVIAAVIDAVAGRAPVSAAYGEWADGGVNAIIDPRLTFVKWGLAGYSGSVSKAYAEMARVSGGRAVLAIYADKDAGHTPENLQLLVLLKKHRPPAVLFDTHRKDGRPLTSHLDRDVMAFITRLRNRGRVAVALAGSLTTLEIPAVARLGPDWIAVRGAACEGGRTGTVTEQKVAELKRLIAESV